MGFTLLLGTKRGARVYRHGAGFSSAMGKECPIPSLCHPLHGGLITCCFWLGPRTHASPPHRLSVPDDHWMVNWTHGSHCPGPTVDHGAVPRMGGHGTRRRMTSVRKGIPFFSHRYWLMLIAVTPKLNHYFWDCLSPFFHSPIASLTFTVSWFHSWKCS